MGTNFGTLPSGTLLCVSATGTVSGAITPSNGGTLVAANVNLDAHCTGGVGLATTVVASGTVPALLIADLPLCVANSPQFP
jgi:hypothetical protein